MIPGDEEMARLRAAFAEDSGPAPDPERCPSPEAILAAVRGELPQHEIRSIIEHTAACSTCAEEWRLAAAFEEGEGEAAREPHYLARPQSRRWHDRLPAYAAAAAAVLVLAVGVQIGRQTGTSKPSVSRGVTAEIRPMSEEDQQRDRCVLAWTEVSDATGYHLEVFDLGGSTVAQADVGGLEYPLCSKLRELPPGTHLKWQVAPVFPPGTRHEFGALATFDLYLR